MTYLYGEELMMLILSIYCDNLYMFNDFKIDFTYNKKINHPLAQKDVLFDGSRIKVRKNFVILGGNASGKTTFGKLLCIICNYIYGRSLEEDNLNIEKIRYDKTKLARFKIEFVINKDMYVLEASFNENGLVRETLKKHKIFKTYNIKVLREIVSGINPVLEYDANDDNKIAMGFRSFVFGNKKYAELIRKNLGFLFMFSEFAKNSYTGAGKINIKMLNALLPRIDNSVEKVVSLQSTDSQVHSLSYMIVFKNGEKITIPDGDLRGCSSRLSHGTFESINFIAVLSEMHFREKNIIYIDEQLAHMHTELEAYFIRKAFLVKPNNTQLFFTTHNLEIFNLNIPNNAFLFFNRNSSGYNETIYPTEKMCKNDRNLRSYYENDYFGVLPEYSTLDEIFERESENE
jgi:ABC-type oligopeptide transport system ATPase subunit